MIRYMIRRLLWAVVLFIAVTLVTFVIFYHDPGRPGPALAAGKAATPAEVKHVAHRLYLDRPIYVQYLHFLRQLVLHHNLGYSYANRQSVNSIVLAAAPVTASLVLGGGGPVDAVAVPVGVFSALRPRSVRDRVAMVSVLAGISVHPCAGSATCCRRSSATTSLSSAADPGLLQLHGSGAGQTCGGPWRLVHAPLLPWFVFAILYCRVLRPDDPLERDGDAERGLRAHRPGQGRARAAGARAARAAKRDAAGGHDARHGRRAGAGRGGLHRDRCSAYPASATWPIQSLHKFDYPITLGVVVFASIMVIIFNLLVDLLYAWIDPRIRLS